MMLRLSLHRRHGDGVTSCGTPAGDEYHGGRAVDDDPAASAAVTGASTAAHCDLQPTVTTPRAVY